MRLARVHSTIPICAPMLQGGYGNGAPAPQNLMATHDLMATPGPTATEVLPVGQNLSIVDAWRAYEVESAGLTIFYPPSWMFIAPGVDDPATP